MTETRDARTARTTATLVLVGALCGLAWAAAMRAYMSGLVGATSDYAWWGTFGGVLLPGVITGGLLGWAEAIRRSGGRRGWRWLALAPLVFGLAVIVLPGGLVSLLTQGLGGGAFAVAVFAMAGGFAISGRGPLWARIACGALFVAFLVGVTLTVPLVSGGRLGLGEPRGAFVAVLGVSLTIVLALASTIPHRAVVDPPA